MPRSPRLLTHLATFFVIVWFGAGAARGQLGEADPREHARLLLSESKAEVARGRRELLTHLTGPELSGAARGELGAEIAPTIREALGRESEFAAVNAVLVAGGLATNESVGIVLEAFEDDRVAVRVAAMTAASWVFDQIENHPPAAFPNRAADLLEGLGEAIRTESDPLVVDGAIRAMSAAWEVDRERFAGVLRDEALRGLALSVRDRLRGMPDEAQSREFYAALARAGEELQRAVRDDLNREFGDAAVREAAREFAAGVVEYIGARIGSGDLTSSPDERSALRREAMAQVLGSTQNLVFIAFRRLSGRGLEREAPDPERLRTAREVREDVEFAEDLRAYYTSSSGVLRREPFAG